MSWLDTLLPASFRGVQAEVERVDDSAGNDLVKHRYPYRNGADVENFGRTEHEIPVEFVLWGEDYESQLKALLDALESLDTGELVHPIFGSMTCHAQTWKVSHSAEEYDYCTVSVTFVEAGADMPFFNRSLPHALGGLAGLQCLTCLDALLLSFENYMGLANAYLDVGGASVSALRGYWERLVTPLFELKADALRVGGDVFSLPRMALSDVLSLFGALQASDEGKFIITPRAESSRVVDGTGVVVSPPESAYKPLFTRDAVVQEVFQIKSRIDDVLAAADSSDVVRAAGGAPVNPRAPTVLGVRDAFDTSLAVVSVVQAAAALAEVFEWELLDPTLSPKQVEAVLNSVRRPLNTAVQAVRFGFVGGDGAGAALSVHLQTLAWQLTAAARAVVHRRPALIRHEVVADCNLHLLAFKLYGDFRRAYEIARLNPKIKNPNVVLAGDVLYVYAE